MGKQVNSRKAIKEVTKRGWQEVRQSGSHKQFKHPEKAPLITIPHPTASLSPGVVRDIEKKAGFRF